MGHGRLLTIYPKATAAGLASLPPSLLPHDARRWSAIRIVGRPSRLFRSGADAGIGNAQAASCLPAVTDTCPPLPGGTETTGGQSCSVSSTLGQPPLLSARCERSQGSPAAVMVALVSTTPAQIVEWVRSGLAARASWHTQLTERLALRAVRRGAMEGNVAPPPPQGGDGAGEGGDAAAAAGLAPEYRIGHPRVAAAAGPRRPVSDVTVYISHEKCTLLAKMLFSLYDWPAFVTWRNEVRHRLLSTPEGACYSSTALVLALSRHMTVANEDPKSALMSYRLSAARLVPSFWIECKVSKLEVCPDH